MVESRGMGLSECWVYGYLELVGVHVQEIGGGAGLEVWTLEVVEAFEIWSLLRVRGLVVWGQCVVVSKEVMGI